MLLPKICLKEVEIEGADWIAENPILPKFHKSSIPNKDLHVLRLICFWNRQMF